ncbi:MAG TPA: hypothetical protein VG474_08360 [Solirubrobacteraceae bacterium]|nr:hypothetical protein [Solirubrobacteraceae bacterium]
MRAAALAAALAALLVAGCGGEPTPSPEQVVSTAVSGVSQGKEQQVCAQLTAGAKKKLLANLADNPLGYPDIKAATCEEGISKLHAQLSKPIRDVLQDGEVDDARIDGDKAVVHVTGAGMDVELQKISDRWMIVDGFFRR